MHRKTKIALAAGAIGLAAAAGIAGPAHASMGHRGHHGMMGGLAERYDGNKDGKVSQEEIDQNRATWFGDFDGDKNAVLSLDEFEKLWLKARRESMVREFQRFDRDGNGQVTLDEYKRPMAGIVAEMDRSGDGALGPDDHRMMRRHDRGGGSGDGGHQ
jgi:Ca2+-binding EF-hand superfamily protein